MTRTFRTAARGLSIAGACLFAGAAFAADLGEPLEVIEAPKAIDSWTGLYLGGFIGGAFSQNDADTIGTSGFQALGTTIVPSSLDLNDNAFLGGVTVGYNHQINRFLLGLEGDFAYTGLNDSASFTGAPVLGTSLTTRATSELDYFGTLRARLGFVPTDRFAIFATGGLAVGHVETEASVTGVAAPGLVWSGSNSDWEFGWTAGAGAEYRIFGPISIKLDGLYYDLSDSNVTAAGNTAVRSIAALNGIDYATEVENRGFMVRLGANIQF